MVENKYICPFDGEVVDLDYCESMVFGAGCSNKNKCANYIQAVATLDLIKCPVCGVDMPKINNFCSMSCYKVSKVIKEDKIK